jgi:hypothetical protein
MSDLPYKKPGPVPRDITREQHVACFLTRADAEYLADFARTYGFKSRSELITYILERLIEGGFSGASGASLALSIQRHCQKENPEAWKQGGFDFGSLRPPPAIPEEHLRKKDVPILLSQIRSQLMEKGTL